MEYSVYSCFRLHILVQLFNLDNTARVLQLIVMYITMSSSCTEEGRGLFLLRGESSAGVKLEEDDVPVLYGIILALQHTLILMAFQTSQMHRPIQRYNSCHINSIILVNFTI